MLMNERGNTAETVPPMCEGQFLQAKHIIRPQCEVGVWPPRVYKALICDLLLEVERLKSGRFTPEEFQRLCHNLPENCTRKTFEKGCREYQNKLFGPKENAE